MKDRDTQIVGNEGMYYVCYRLSQMGLNAMPTARNAKGVDVVVYDSKGTAYLGLQVKTLSERWPVPLGTGKVHAQSDFWCIVNLNKKKGSAAQPRVFVMTPEEIAAGMSGSKSKWLQPPVYDRGQYEERWNRICEKLEDESRKRSSCE